MRDEDKSPLRSLEEVKEELRARTEKAIHEKFGWQKVEEWVESIYKEQVERIAMFAFGFKRDWHDRSWEVNTSQSPVVDLVKKIAANWAEEHLPALIEPFKTAAVKQLRSKETKDRLKGVFNQQFDWRLRNRLEEMAKAQAETAADSFLQAEGEQILKELKLKNPITLGSIELLANPPKPPEADDD
jgi:uncharacterized protein (DUF1697 family)